jgi:hypothetical protein
LINKVGLLRVGPVRKWAVCVVLPTLRGRSFMLLRTAASPA